LTALLRAANHEVFTVTYTGLGESARWSALEGAGDTHFVRKPVPSHFQVGTRKGGPFEVRTIKVGLFKSMSFPRERTRT
jgi:hypothetical protein